MLGKQEGRSGGMTGFQTSLHTSYLSNRWPKAQILDLVLCYFITSELCLCMSFHLKKMLPLKMYPALFFWSFQPMLDCVVIVSVWLSIIFPTSHPFPALLMAKFLWKFPCVHQWENRFSVCQRNPWQTAKCLMYLVGEISGLLSQRSAEVSTHVSTLSVSRD